METVEITVAKRAVVEGDVAYSWPDIPAGVSWSLVSDNGDTYTIRVSEADAVIVGGAE